MNQLHALVVTGGPPPPHTLSEHIPRHDFVVAADSGLEIAHSLGLRVTHAIGDMDSVNPEMLAELERTGAVVQRVPQDKDQVDTELAIVFARTLGAEVITVITGGGGRLDHQLGVLSVLTHPILNGCEVHALWDTARVRVLRGPETATLTGDPGSLIGIVASNGVTRGITTSGLRWPLTEEDLESHSTRGVSNQLVTDSATITVQSGFLFVIQPHAHSAEPSRGKN
jgi:thiamine pyrophosphokinase